MIEKQNAVESKSAAGDAAEIDDVIDAGARQFSKPCERAKHSHGSVVLAGDKPAVR